MKTIETIENDLINGKSFVFYNDNLPEDFDMEIYYFKSDKYGWMTGFKIEINGKLQHSYKRFKPFMKNVNFLISSNDLELYENNHE